MLQHETLCSSRVLCVPPYAPCAVSCSDLQQARECISRAQQAATEARTDPYLLLTHANVVMASLRPEAPSKLAHKPEEARRQADSINKVRRHGVWGCWRPLRGIAATRAGASPEVACAGCSVQYGSNRSSSTCLVPSAKSWCLVYQTGQVSMLLAWLSDTLFGTRILTNRTACSCVDHPAPWLLHCRRWRTTRRCSRRSRTTSTPSTA